MSGPCCSLVQAKPSDGLHRTPSSTGAARCEHIPAFPWAHSQLPHILGRVGAHKLKHLQPCSIFALSRAQLLPLTVSWREQHLFLSVRPRAL